MDMDIDFNATPDLLTASEMQSGDFVFDRLPDPLGDRVVKEVPLPPHRPLGVTQVYPQYLQFGNIAKPNYKIVRECLVLDGTLEKKVLLKLIQDCLKVTQKEPNVVPRTGDIAIIGDVHGQFFDLVSMLDEFTPKLERMESGFGLLFLGDYVDRGIQSVEVMAYLMCIKILFPKQVTLLRGNHESRSMTSYFTFRQECVDKYDVELYDAMMELFDSLPLMATVNELYLCVHGGISPEMFSLDDVNTKVNRFMEPPNVGLFCDILWSDPIAENEVAVVTDYARNEARYCSFLFGLRPLKNLLRKERLLTLIRAHEVQQDGFNMYMWEGQENFPLAITVFSAPNYCGTYGNRAAVAISNMNDPEQLKIQQFDPSQDLAKPYQLPNDMDVLHWSVPFLCDCITKMFYALLSQHNEIYDAEAERDKLDEKPAAEVAAEVNLLLKRRLS